MALDVRPLTTETWKDLVELFTRPGAGMARACWCMYYRKGGGGEASSEDRAGANRRAMKALVNRGVTPGLIGYEDGRPVGWISLGPRADYPKLRRSPVMKPVDEKPVWSIVCFFVDRRARGRGVSEALLQAAIEHARTQGASLLEAYPVDKPDRSHADFMWFGAKSMYDRLGFREVVRRKETRPVVRKTIRPRRSSASSSRPASATAPRVAGSGRQRRPPEH